LHPIDFTVVLLVMLSVTYVGHRLSGNIKDRKGFFQADGSMPWWAVSASIIATVVSSVTFISVPAAVFAEGGNLTYFQVILGLAAGKVVVARMLARPFYESQGLATSYEYIARRIDPATGEFSMYLGLLLNVINSGVKLLTAGLVLDVISGWGLAPCALFVMVISVFWGALAGIKTVIWTDFLLFGLFALGAGFALIYMLLGLERSLPDTIIWLDEQAKLVLFDFDTDPEKRYTIWAGVIGAIGLSIAQGSTQGTWQRVKACRSVGDAQKAFDFAALFYVMHLVILGVGLALVAFYGERGLPDEIALELASSPDRIFPHFIATELPVGISGIFIAAIFAAAISTLDSALAESSDLTVNHIYSRWRPAETETHYLRASRAFMLIWGLIFFALALFFGKYSAEGLLDLTFKLPNYLYGAIFGSIILARFGIGTFPTIILGFALACLLVVWMSSAGIAFFYWCPVSGLSMVALVWALNPKTPEWRGVVD
jgi:SSS family solute:Na+ symporter